MPGPLTGSPEDVFRALSSDVGTENFTINLGNPTVSTVNVTCTTTALSASFQTMEGQTEDAIVLGHSLSFSPTNAGDHPIKMYRVIVRPWQPGMLPMLFTPGSWEDRNVFGTWTVGFGPWGAFVHAIEEAVGKTNFGSAQDVSGAILVKSTPDTTEGGTTFTTGVSDTIGGSVGFFGEDPTASISGSVTFSHSESRTIPDLRIRNKSSGAIAYTEMLLGPDWPSFDTVDIQQNTFEPSIENYWKIPDSGQKVFPRTNEPGHSEAAVLLFEVTFQAFAYDGQTWLGIVPGVAWGQYRLIIPIRQPPIQD